MVVGLACGRARSMRSGPLEAMDTTTPARQILHCYFRGTTERPSKGGVHARLGRSIRKRVRLPQLARTTIMATSANAQQLLGRCTSQEPETMGRALRLRTTPSSSFQ
jgi:hypothetical protein